MTFNNDWAPVEKAAHRPTIVYCSGTNSSGRADAISSGALAVALELRAALVAFDFVGSGGSDDGVTWTRLKNRTHLGEE